MRLAFVMLAVVSGGIVPGLSARAETVTFEGAQVGSLPPAFQPGLTGKGQTGVWAVVEDATAKGGRALEQRTPDETDYRFPIAIHDPVSARDVEVTVRFKPIYGKLDQAGGVAVRFIDENNYYVARANALENNVRFYRVVGGTRQEIKGVNTRVSNREWHTLSLTARGATFVVGLDGEDLFTATDATFGGEGRIALWTKADSITRFDQIEIKRLD